MAIYVSTILGTSTSRSIYQGAFAVWDVVILLGVASYNFDSQWKAWKLAFLVNRDWSWMRLHYRSRLMLSPVSLTLRNILQTRCFPSLAFVFDFRCWCWTAELRVDVTRFPVQTGEYSEHHHQGVIIKLVLLKTHWDRVTHRCVGKLTIIDSDNGLSPSPGAMLECC